MPNLPQKVVMVSWDDDLDQPTVDKEEIEVKISEGPAVIVWRHNPATVEKINAIVLNEKTDDPAGEFSAPQAGGGVGSKTWVSVDFATRLGEFSYSVLATKKNGTGPKLLDPMINNHP